MLISPFTSEEPNDGGWLMVDVEETEGGADGLAGVMVREPKVDEDGAAVRGLKVSEKDEADDGARARVAVLLPLIDIDMAGEMPTLAADGEEEADKTDLAGAAVGVWTGAGCCFC